MTTESTSVPLVTQSVFQLASDGEESKSTNTREHSTEEFTPFVVVMISFLSSFY